MRVESDLGIIRDAQPFTQQRGREPDCRGRNADARDDPPPLGLRKNRLMGTGGGNSFPLREKLEEKGAQNEPEEMEVQNRESVQRRRNV